MSNCSASTEPPPAHSEDQDNPERPDLAELSQRADALDAQIRDHLTRGRKK